MRLRGGSSDCCFMIGIRCLNLERLVILEMQFRKEGISLINHLKLPQNRKFKVHFFHCSLFFNGIASGMKFANK